MKYVVGVMIILIGLSLVGLGLAVRVQFGAAVNQANPNFDDYPLLKPFVPEPAASNGVGASAANEIAETIQFRIYSLAAVGVAVAVVGALFLTLLVTFRKRAVWPLVKEVRR